jgi:shikimate dehydrogenase
MHNAAFAALGLDWQYVALPVPPESLAMVVAGLGALGFRGANVTVPHKERILPLLDSLVSQAKELGAVNTLVFDQQADGPVAVAGHNTDAAGFVAALRHGGFEPEEGGAAVVVGAGGAARATTYGLLRSGIGKILVLNRTLARARALVSGLDCRGDASGRMEAAPLTDEMLIESAREASLLVNTTTVGMWPHADDSIWPDDAPIPRHLAVFDLVYNPMETRLLRQAQESGGHPIGGLEMLVRQGALAFEMWTGYPAPVDTMRAAAGGALRASLGA